MKNDKNNHHQRQAEPEGLAAKKKHINSCDSPLGRSGIKSSALDELLQLSMHHEVLHCLKKHGYCLVYDAGVKRLLRTVRMGGGKNN